MVSDGGTKCCASPANDEVAIASAGGPPLRLHATSATARTVVAMVQHGRSRSNEAKASYTKMHGNASAEITAKSDDMKNLSGFR